MQEQPQPESARHPTLFSPLSMRTLRLANRATVAPMTRTSAHVDGTATKQMIEYYRRFARGGFGLVITEGTYTDTVHAQGYYRQPGIATDAQTIAWQPVVEAVHAAGAAIIVQLMHAGAQSQHAETVNVAPSPIRPYGKTNPIYHGEAVGYPLPEALSGAGINEVVEGFVNAAHCARQAGFDGVEIHGANGYLLDEFLTTYHNRRDDEYGGDVHNRVRMTKQVVHSVHEAVGDDMTVGVRLSQAKINDMDYRWNGPEDAAAIFEAMAGANADYIHLTGPGAVEPAFSGNGPSLVELAVQHGDGAAVIANGGLQDADKAETQLHASGASLVAVARGALANPDWPRRVAERCTLKDFEPAMLDPLATLDNQAGWEASRGGMLEPLNTMGG